MKRASECVVDDFLSEYAQLWLEEHGCYSMADKIRGYCADVEYDEELLIKALKKKGISCE